MSDIVVSDRKLSRLADEINEAHNYCDEAFRYTLNHAITAGEKLIQAKELCGHGNWYKWHDDNINHGIDTSRTYMRFGKHKEFILSNAEKFRHLGIDNARKLLPDYKKPIIPDSTGDEWWTPKEYIDSVRAVLGEIDLDPASCEQANEIVQAKHYFTEEDDGLLQAWWGRVFMNPPYSQNKAFAEKLLSEFDLGNMTECVLLVGAHAIETQWFRRMWDYVLCFTGHRIKFETPEGKKVAGNISGSVFVYLGEKDYKFAEEFGKHGFVVRRWP